MMDKTAIDEEEHRIFESHIKEETQALRIAVLDQHLKNITDEAEAIRLKE